MPSLRANLAFYAVQYKFSHRKHATPQQILDDVRDTWRQENAPEVVPTSDEEVFAGAQVFHVRPRGERVETGKVVVYWHGGAFIRRMQDRHWIFVQKLADQLKCDVVVPIYTLAPLATGTSCVQTSLELLAHLQTDVRYQGKQFVLAGDSAGGWIALRVLLALSERLAGKTTFRSREEHVEERELKLKQPEEIDYKAILDSVSDVLMISPVVDAIVDRPEDLEAEKKDPWLSKNIIDVCARLWSYGPSHAYPDYDFDLPAEQAALPIVSDRTDLPPLDDPRFSPINGLDILREYEGMERIRVTTFIGTNDILYPQNVRMQARLEALGVKSDLHVYDGLFHVFPLLPWLPESMDAFGKIRALF
ncbi:hypothetical protein NCC49_000010 [Naganishia albida]|nr:hypothetical protein NCC49_000010 [Naganishia albida]